MNMFEVGSSKKKAKIFIKHKQSIQFWDLNVNMLVKQFFLNFQISVQVLFFLNFVKFFLQNIFHQEVGWILQCGTSGYRGPTVLPLQLFKVKHPIPLCPLAAVRIKGVGDGKETEKFSIICNFRNRLQAITLLITFQGSWSCMNRWDFRIHWQV